MKTAVIFLLSVVPFFQPAGLSALDFGLPAEKPAAAPAASAPSAEPLLREYAGYYAALADYSDRAFSLAQDSGDYYDAQARGSYLRARVEELSSAILKMAAADPCAVRRSAAALGAGNFTELLSRLPAASCRVPDSPVPAVRVRRGVSPGISAELDSLFASDKRAPARDGAIRAGYCRINYVKGNVPFLVQYDGFLKKGEIVITFDDGPGSHSPEVAAAMKEGKAPSIFFVLGEKLGVSGKTQIKAEAADGHSVAVHGYHHATDKGKPFTAYSTEKILQQLGGVSASIAGATGQTPKFFRPPYGIIDPDALRTIHAELGLVPVGWTIDTMDWSTKDPEALYANTVSMIKKRGKGIVLMHDIHAQSRAAVVKLVKWLGENGYTVVSPDRLAEAYGK